MFVVMAEMPYFQDRITLPFHCVVCEPTSVLSKARRPSRPTGLEHDLSLLNLRKYQAGKPNVASGSQTSAAFAGCSPD